MGWHSRARILLVNGSIEVVRVELRAPEFDWVPIDAVQPFPDLDLEIAVDGTEALRARLVEVVEPQLTMWQQRSRLASPLPIAVGFVTADGDAVEVGQGFVVTDSGLVRSTYDVPGEPFADVLRAYRAGLIYGDPRHVVVWPQPPRAGLGGAGWSEFAHGLDLLWSVWKEIGAGTATALVMRDLYRRFRRCSGVLERHAPELEERGFSPTNVVFLIDARAWFTEELAVALGLTEDEIVELVVGFGMAHDDDRLWRVVDHDVRELAVELIAASIGFEASTGDDTGLIARYRELLSKYGSSRRVE